MTGAAGGFDNKVHNLLSQPRDTYDNLDSDSEAPGSSSKSRKPLLSTTKVFYKPGANPNVIMSDNAAEPLLGDSMPGGSTSCPSGSECVRSSSSEKNTRCPSCSSEGGDILKEGLAVALPETSRNVKPYTKFPNNANKLQDGLFDPD